MLCQPMEEVWFSSPPEVDHQSTHKTLHAQQVIPP